MVGFSLRFLWGCDGERAAVAFLVNYGVERHRRAHQGLVALHDTAVALDPAARVGAGQAVAVAVEQLKIVLLGQQGQHQLVDALATVAHGGGIGQGKGSLCGAVSRPKFRSKLL